MCLIIVNMPGSDLPISALDNGWQENPDGAGYAFCADGKLIIRKAYHKLKLLKADLAADRAKYASVSPFLIHFRWATHGDKTAENCHPHPICGGEIALAHNGILHDFAPSWNEKHSDTVQFCRTVLAYRCAAHVIDDKFNGILADMIGGHNKFAMLRETGEVSIVNEDKGVWDGGNWYSNVSYLPKKQYVFPLSQALPARYRGAIRPTDSLFTRDNIDPWDEIDAQIAENEYDCTLAEIDRLDITGWDNLTPGEQDAYCAMYEKLGAMERQLDSRLH